MTESGRVAFDLDFSDKGNVYIVGIDQLIVDIEAKVPETILSEYQIKKGQSTVVDDTILERLYHKLKKSNFIVGEFAGGAVGNTLHNYSLLSEARSVNLGAISKHIAVGDYAFKYLCTTHSLVDLSYLMPVDGPMSRALCLITPDGERTFLIAKGISNELTVEYLPEDLIAKARVLLVSAYSFRDENSPLYKAHMHALELALKHSVPVVLSLGTSSLIEEKKDFFIKLITKYVSVCAMNELESKSLTQISDPLTSLQKILDWCDLALLTHGPKGLYIGGYTDQRLKRETKDPICSKSIAEYNRYEYSRAMKRADCLGPIKIYTHMNPYLGGGVEIKNTNGAGDAALSALIHDMASNTYHRELLPHSPKHQVPCLTYSSIHQISKYCNRVSFEILKQNSPRLAKGLPNRDESLEDAYWDL